MLRSFFHLRQNTGLLCLLLVDVGSGDADGERANAGNHTDTLGDADGSASVENVEQVRALQAEVEGGENREAVAVFGGRSWLFAIRFSVTARFGRLALLGEARVVLV